MRPIPRKQTTKHTKHTKTNFRVFRVFRGLVHAQATRLALLAFSSAVAFGGGLRAAENFRVAELDGRWRFLTPDGKPWIALGINHAGQFGTKDRSLLDYEKTVQFARHGRDFAAVYGELFERLRGWGFNCGGYDAPEAWWSRWPFATVTQTGLNASFYAEKLEYADVFSPAYEQFAAGAARTAAARVRGQRQFLGYFWRDCTRWDLGQARASHGTDWVSWIRALPAGASGKNRYVAFLREQFGGDVTRLNASYGTTLARFDDLAALDFSSLDRSRADVLAHDRAFLRLIARAYFQTLGQAFRAADSQAILFGDRFHLRDLPREVLEEAASVVDVIAIQPGDHHHPLPFPLEQPDETRFDTAAFDALHAIAKKPIILCDHQAGFFAPSTPQTGYWHQYPNAETAAASYDRFLRAAFARPYIIGYFRCQVVSAWNARARHYKQGLLDPRGEPFADFVERIAQTNRDLTRETLGTAPP